MSDKTQQVRERAYRIWQAHGEPEGRHTDHWLQAEQELGKSIDMNRSGFAGGCLV